MTDEYVDRVSKTVFTCYRCRVSVATVNDDCFFVPVMPKGWRYVDRFLLCDVCGSHFEHWLNKFMNDMVKQG